MRTLIVEDEPAARSILAGYLAEIPWVEPCGEAADGIAALQAVDSLRPELLLLDVVLPGMSGLEVLEKARHRPEVVFTTAHDEFAVPALHAGALDYLLKPFGRHQFQFLMEKVRERLAVPRAAPRDADRALEVFRSPRPLKRIFVRHSGEIVPVLLHQVQHVEACDDYVQLHLASATYLAQIPIGTLEALVDPDVLVRIHRSHLVNLDHVARLRPYDARRLLVVLRSGKEIVASRAGTKRLEGFVA